MFCAPGLVFGGAEVVGARFHVLRARTRFRLYRGRRVRFSCFAHPDSFSAVPRASRPLFMFCAPGLIFDGTKGVRSRFHILRSLTRFQRYRGRRVPFLAVPRASGPVFMFFTSEFIFGGTDGVGYRFHVLHPGLIFGGTEGVGTRFHVLRARTRFRR
jgi:hypothetical protein